jgi:type IV pilus assembly protein PilM
MKPPFAGARLAWRAVRAPIGLDFAGERLNLLQVEPGAQAPVVRAAAALPYPFDRSALLADRRRLRRFVRDALASAPFAGRRVIAALAPADVRIQSLTVQLAPGESERQAVARQVREQLGAGKAEESVVDYIPVRGPDGTGPQRQALVAVAPVRKIVAYLDTLRGVGLEPVALDVGPAAIARLLAAMQEDDTQAVILVNFGASKSYLSVVSGQGLMLDRQIDFGETQLVDKLANVLRLAPAAALALLREHGTGDPQARPGAASHRDMGRAIREILHPQFATLAEELARTQVYIASRTRGASARRIYLNGNVTRYAHLPDHVAAIAHLPVEVLDPFRAFRLAPGFAPAGNVAHGIALAAGLALRGRAHG